MKKNVCGVGKKVLASALSAAMVVAFAPAVGSAVGSDNAVAYASDNQVSTNIVSVSSVEDLTTAVEEGKSIILNENITLAEPLGIEEGADVVFDLNGKSLVVSGDCGVLVAGKLAVRDSVGSGLIKSNNDGESPVGVGENGVFTLESGSLVSEKSYGINCWDGGTAVINGGAIESYWAPLTGNNTTGDMNFVVNGGTLTAKMGPAIYMPGQGSLSISGGVLNGGISLRMGQVDISGGTINAMEDENSIDKPNGKVGNSPSYAYSGNVWFPDALYVIGGTYTSDDASYGNSLKLEITGGTFNCGNSLGSAVAIYDLGKVGQQMEVSVSGNPVFNSKAVDRSAYQVVSLSDLGDQNPAEGFNNSDYVGKVVSSISGGTFSSDPSKYLAPGYVVNSNGSYTVSKYVAPTPTPTPTPTPEPTPEPTPAAPGTGVSGTDAAGNTVDATVTDNSKVTLPDGIKVDGSVEYKGTTSASGSAELASTVSVPSTVTTSDGSTYVVTKIADKAFEGQEQLTKVTIPETVVEIGDRAFAGTSVENVVLPAATTVIGAGVFQGCDDLKSVDISKAAITEIPADSFNGTSIDSIEIPATVTSIGARAFKGTALTSAELPDAVKAIEKSTFENCAALKSLTTSATVVGYKALAGCTSLRGIDLSKATELGKYALKGDSKLKTVTTGAKLKAIGYKALSGTKVKTLTISSKKLTSASVKGSLKGSSVKKVEVAVSGSKKTVNKYVAKYKKVFKKSNSGKSVDVVAKRIK